jgi:hypothetical protein
MLVLPGKARVDPFGEKSKKGINIPFPWSVNSAGPQNEKRDFVSMSKG